MAGNAQSLAARLRAGEPLLGLVVRLPGPQIVECAGHCGYDLIVIDTEHGPDDMVSLEHHVRAADSVGVPVLVRVGRVPGNEVLRVLDAGAQGIVVPHVDTSDQAAQAVLIAHYPPRGTRGLATTTRAGRHGLTEAAEHVRRALDETIVVAQVEDAAALPNVKAIASEAGIDAVFLGPADLSVSLGHPGEYSHPRVLAAIQNASDDVLETQAAALCTLVRDETEARAWWDRGAQIVLFAAPAVISKRLDDIARTVRAQRTALPGQTFLEKVNRARKR